MKKISALLIIALSIVSFAFAGGGCIIDSTNTRFLAPHPDSIPCVEKTVFYSESVQLLVPDSIDLINYGSPFSFVLYVDSVILTGLSGLPVGINANVNPAPGVFYPGQYACVQMTGTATDTTGHYYLIPQGSITAHGTPYPPIFDGDTTVDLATLQLLSQGELDLYVDVINRGEACRSLWPAVVCIPDSSNTRFFSPRPDSLPCVERTRPYEEVIQIAVPVSIDLQDFGAPLPFVLFVDSVVITGANGLPSGIAYTSNPSNGVLYGGGFGCALVTGTTTDPVGRYPITFNGSFTAHGQAFPPFFDGDTTINFADLQGLSQGAFDLFVDVIEPGTPCRPELLAVESFSADLNSMFSVYPNPSTGIITVNMKAGRRISGELTVVDINGRKVWTQAMDIKGLYSSTIDLSNLAKGLYTIQLRTPEGFVAKNISIE